MQMSKRQSEATLDQEGGEADKSPTTVPLLLIPPT